MVRKVDFFILPDEENKARLEGILNDKNCVIINRKEDINAKFGLALIYLEYEDYNDEIEKDNFY